MIASSDTNEIATPVLVTIPAGLTSVQFAIEVVDDAVVDGGQTVTIRAEAAGFETGEASLEVNDDDAATLTLSIAAAAAVEGTSVAATVTRNTDITDPLTVTLFSSDVSEATTPATVVIPAGAASVEFTINLLDDATLCLRWRESLFDMKAAASGHDFVRIVEQRRRYLDELQRRSPDGFSAWLASGPRATGDPMRFLRNQPPTASA